MEEVSSPAPLRPLSLSTREAEPGTHIHDVTSCSAGVSVGSGIPLATLGGAALTPRPLLCLRPWAHPDLSLSFKAPESEDYHTGPLTQIQVEAPVSEPSFYSSPNPPPQASVMNLLVILGPGFSQTAAKGHPGPHHILRDALKIFLPDP